MGYVVGIDASRNRSGGAKVHLRGILTDSDPRDFGIERVHVWSYSSLLDALPVAPWLVKHNPPQLQRSIFQQVWWQYRQLPIEAHAAGCQVMLNTDAGSVCPFHPAVTMSRDMLSYEKGEMQRFGLSLARLRLILLKYMQANSLKRADGVIFLTRYAAEVIQEFTGKLPRVGIIPHGVSDIFRQTTGFGSWLQESDKTIRCLYISNASMYKHQWHVVQALGKLREKGYNLSLLLVGGGKGRAQKLLEEEIARTDPNRLFVKTQGFAHHQDIPRLLANADIFIFASSCENMPNTLVEAMASGLPIACSNRGPMPEVLEDGGVFFNPEDPESISVAVEQIILEIELRVHIAHRAKALSEKYSWSRCARETWQFLTTQIDKRENLSEVKK